MSRWIHVADETSNRVYYYNPQSGEVRWTLPGSKWREYVDNEGRIYYSHIETKETRWEKPDELSTRALYIHGKPRSSDIAYDEVSVSTTGDDAEDDEDDTAELSRDESELNISRDEKSFVKKSLFVTEILEDPEKVLEFEKYLESVTQSPANVKFYSAVNNYKALSEGSPEQKQVAMEILHLYVIDGATMEVSAERLIREELQEDIEKGKINSKTFDGLQAVVRQSIEVTEFPVFVAYKALLPEQQKSKHQKPIKSAHHHRQRQKPLTESTERLCEGFLKKKSPKALVTGQHVWQRRYFLLHSDVLIYMKDKGGTPVGVVPIRTVAYTALTPQKGVDRFEIMVHAGGEERRFEFQAGGQEDAKRWVTKLSDAKAKIEGLEKDRTRHTKLGDKFWKSRRDIWAPGLESNDELDFRIVDGVYRVPGRSLKKIRTATIGRWNEKEKIRLAAMRRGELLFKGFLKKKSQTGLYSRQRFVELYENLFLYFKDHINRDHVGGLDLRHIEEVRLTGVRKTIIEIARKPLSELLPSSQSSSEKTGAPPSSAPTESSSTSVGQVTTFEAYDPYTANEWYQKIQEAVKQRRLQPADKDDKEVQQEEETSRPLLKGLLKKSAKRGLLWHSRYFELYENVLVYWVSDAERREPPLDVVELRNVTTVLLSDSNPTRFEMNRLIPSKPLSIEAKDEASCREWVSAIRNKVGVAKVLRTKDGFLDLVDFNYNHIRDAPSRTMRVERQEDMAEKMAKWEEDHPYVGVPLDKYPFNKSDTKEVIVFDQNVTSGPSAIRATKFDKLLHYCTHQTFNDFTTRYTLLQTYWSFTNPIELCDKLALRFCVPIPPELERNFGPGGGTVEAARHAYKLSVVARIQTKVCALFTNWIKECWVDFQNEPRLQSHVEKRLEALQDHCAAPYSLKVLRNLRELLKKYRKTKSEDKEGKEPSASSSRRRRASIVLDYVHSSPPAPKTEFKGTEVTFDDFSELELARQLCILDFRYFSAIEPRECLNQAWMKKDKEKKAPNILKTTNHFNKVSCWVQLTICSAADLQGRAARFSKFIQIASHCQELRNYSSLFAIYSALTSSACFRLNKTKAQLPEKRDKALAKLEELFKVDNNHAAFRKVLEASPTPCIPYMGLYLTDFTFIDEGNQDTTPEGLINFYKRRLLAERILQIKRYQAHPYNLEPVQAIRDYFRKSLQVVDESVLWSMSMEVEPDV